MSTIELKSSLHNLIEDIEDKDILSAVYLLLAKQRNKAVVKDFWDELPEYVKAGIEEGLAQSERGEGIPHDKVMKQIKAKYQRA
jgi:predicted transcriptional regulator